MDFLSAPSAALAPAAVASGPPLGRALASVIGLCLLTASLFLASRSCQLVDKAIVAVRISGEEAGHVPAVVLAFAAVGTAGLATVIAGFAATRLLVSHKVPFA